MGKTFYKILLTNTCSSAWWYCYTQQATIGETPVLALALSSSIVILLYIAAWAFNNWD